MKHDTEKPPMTPKDAKKQAVQAMNRIDAMERAKHNVIANVEQRYWNKVHEYVSELPAEVQEELPKEYRRG